MHPQLWAANRRVIPAGMFMAFKAPSMRNVPDPQKGSYSMLSRRTPATSRIPAARVSLMGASVEFRRYPRLWSPGPEVSRKTLTRSLRIWNWI